MKSFDYDAYIFDGAVLCCACITGLTILGEEDPDLSPIFADSEWDYFPCCSICESEIDYVALIESE